MVMKKMSRSVGVFYFSWEWGGFDLLRTFFGNEKYSVGQGKWPFMKR